MSSCGFTRKASLPERVFFNGQIYTADTLARSFSAVAVRSGRILALGNDAEILGMAGSVTERIDLKGRFVMPGFIEGHGHLRSLGESLQHLNLSRAPSWDTVVAMVSGKVLSTPTGDWIEGRGWHQEKWLGFTGYPEHRALSQVSSKHPVVLFHASGHALLANARAMELAGIDRETADPVGGHIVRDASGSPTGVFEENAMNLIERPLQAWKDKRSEAEKVADFQRSIKLAARHCLSHGVTSFQDAGSTLWELKAYQRMAETGQLGVRLWAMVAQSSVDRFDQLRDYPVIGRGDGFFTCRAVKAYYDGALGSYGALLLEPYADNLSTSGQLVTPSERIVELARWCREAGLQFCVHGIGDRANREILDIYDRVLPSISDKSNDYGSNRGGLRWRIEHAQHLNPSDIGRFREMGVIAAMQAIHCTSDAVFVESRLGPGRAQSGAYVWRSLLDSGVRLANGTDVPVEEVNPLRCLYASITRRSELTGKVFYPNQCMNREEALRSYTAWNAYAAFEEAEKGTLSPGKFADMVVLSADIRNCLPEELLKTKVLRTIIGGRVVFSDRNE